MKHVLLAGLASFSLVTSAQAGFMVVGTETTSGNYSFTLQGMTGDPIQNRTTGSFNILDFAIDLPGLVIFSPAGNISDGTNSMTPTLFGWTAPSGINSFDPAGINAQVVTASGDAGVDLTTVTWRFASEEGLNGTVVVETEPPPPSAVPEPSTFVLLTIGGLALVGYGWRRKRQQAT